MRKRVCVLLLALLLILSLCACGASLEQAAAVEEAEAAPSEEPTAALSPLEQLIADAEAGDTEAMCKLGEMYRDGDGVEANLEEARSWYGKAGEAGHAYAYLWLADSYYFPNYGTQDYDKAFERLVNNHSQEAEICLSFLLKYIVYSLYATEEVGYTIEAADDVMATGFNWCPPLAMYQALSTVADVPALIRERLPEIVEKVDIDRLLADVKPSKYDYRLYFKSGR